MARKEREEQVKIYNIPVNFVDEDKIFGGMIKTRNFVEGCIIALILMIPFLVLPIPFKVKLVLCLVFGVTAIALGCMGINGDAISVFLLYFKQFKDKKRVVRFNGRIKLHQRNMDIDNGKELPRDKVIKFFKNLGVSRENATEEDIQFAEDFVFDDDVQDIEEIKAKMINIDDNYGEDVSDNYAKVIDIGDVNVIIQEFEESELNMAILEDEFENSDNIDIEVLGTEDVEDIDNKVFVVDDYLVTNNKNTNQTIFETDVTTELEMDDIIFDDGFVNEAVDIADIKVLDTDKAVNRNTNKLQTNKMPQRQKVQANNVPGINNNVQPKVQQKLNTRQDVLTIKPNMQPRRTDINQSHQQESDRNVNKKWTCSKCLTLNIGKFCSKCGTPRH